MALTAQQNIWTGRVAVSRGLSAGDFLGSCVLQRNTDKEVMMT
jgi:hypothetical protein